MKLIGKNLAGKQVCKKVVSGMSLQFLGCINAQYQRKYAANSGLFKNAEYSTIIKSGTVYQLCFKASFFADEKWSKCRGTTSKSGHTDNERYDWYSLFLGST